MANSNRSTKEFVLDNSIAMAWSFEDESDAYADTVLDALAKSVAIVPALWPLEVANALIVGERRKRFTQADTARWIGILTALPIIVDSETNARAWVETLNLARSHKLSAYDAAYLELAIRRNLSLATLDQGLKTAALASGVALVEAF